MEVEERTLSFSIQGEFITQLTREWFYCAEKVQEWFQKCEERKKHPKFNFVEV